jgi:type I restriction enzyme S subunit
MIIGASTFCRRSGPLADLAEIIEPDASVRHFKPYPEYKDSGVQWLGEIPAHWDIKRLSWLTTCLDGRRIPLNSEERGSMQGEYPYWGANSIVDYVDNWLLNEELVLLGEDGAPFFDKNRPVSFHYLEKSGSTTMRMCFAQAA